jgi:hypothetical protein
MAVKPSILTLSEFLKLRGKQRKSVLIYFNEEQWNNLTAKAKPGNRKPNETESITLSLITLPDIDGGFVEIRCPVGGPITGAEGELRCGKNPGVNFPSPNTPGVKPNFCTMILHKDGSVTCSGVCSEGKNNCKLGYYSVPTKTPGVKVLIMHCHCSQ